MQRPTIDVSGLVRALEELEALDDAIDERENLYRAYLDNERTARKLGADPAESLHEAKYTSATGEHLAGQAGTSEQSRRGAAPTGERPLALYPNLEVT